jgi:hypothetical protein
VHVLRANLSLCVIIAAALLLELTMENMDSINYERMDNLNVLTLRKSLNFEH